MKTILALDPSTTIAGWAFGSEKGLIDYGLVKNSDPLQEPMDRASEMAYEIIRKVQQHHVVVHDFIMEEPDTWQSSRGQKAAMSGALTQLALGAGCMYAHIRTALVPFNSFRATPQKWKGQLPKELLYDRMVQKYHLTDIARNPSGFNVTDAVGLLDWHLKRRR